MPPTLVEVLSNDIEFVKQSILGKGFYTHDFIRNYADRSGKVAGYVERRLVDICDDARARLTADRGATNDSRISHRMWLTNSDSPHEANVEFLNCCTYAWKNCFDPDWKHNFWLIDESKIPQTVGLLKDAYPDVTFLNPNDHLSDGPWRRVFDAFMRDGKYTGASDVLRLQVLHEYGGLYTDLGIGFKQSAADLFSKFDYVMIFWENLFLQNSLMFMNKNNTITNIFQNYYSGERPYPLNNLSDMSAMSEMLLFSGPNITTLLLDLPEGRSILPLAANREFVSWMAQQSWYTRTESGEGKYGNAYIPEAKLSILPNS